jgi:hypothetical protein
MAEREALPDDLEDLPSDLEDLSAAPSDAVPAAAMAPTAAPADPGVLAAIRASYAQGSLKGASDEMIGGIVRALGPEGAPGHTGADIYRGARDAEREILRGAQEHHPVVSVLADLTGDLASDFLASRLGVSGVGSAPYNVAVGGLSGFNRSTADLSDSQASVATAAQASEDTARGAAMGYVAPKVGEKVAKGLAGVGAVAGRKLGNALSEGAPSLEEGFRRFAQERALKAVGYIQKDFPRAASKLRNLRAGGHDHCRPP